MTWNYRVIIDDTDPDVGPRYSITEVYYDNDGKVQAWVDPAELAPLSNWDDYGDLVGTVKYAAMAMRRPPLKKSELPG